MAKKLFCPACGKDRLESLTCFPSFPAVLFPAEEWRHQEIDTAPISAVCCQDCNHVFLKNIDVDFLRLLYAKYYNLYPYKALESMSIPYRNPFEAVANFFLDSEGKTLLEIGCDDMEQLRFFLDRGLECTAINPGAIQSNGAKFINGYYGVDKVHGRYDVVVSRFNLEHIPDLPSYFQAINDNTHDQSIILMQVPNTEYFFRSGMLNIFAHEHPHYFCRNSLCALVNRYKYEVMYLTESQQPSLICAMRHSGNDGEYQPEKCVKQSQVVSDSLIDLVIQAPGNVILYGAGLSLAGLLYCNEMPDEVQKKITIVDDNKLLNGRYMPNTNLKICAFDRKLLQENSIIILTLNEVYHKNVVRRLKQICSHIQIYRISKRGLLKI